MAKKLARVVDRRYLASGADAGIDAEHGELTRRRRQQQVLQVFAEHLNGVGIGALLQLQAHLRGDGAVEQTLPGVLRGQVQLRRPVAGPLVDLALDDVERALRIELDHEVQHALRLAAADGQHPVRGDLLDRLPIVVIHLELFLLVFVIITGVGHFAADDHALLEHGMAQQLANIGVVADGLGQDVARAFQRLLHAGDAFLGINKRRRKCFERNAGGFLRPQIIRERPQPAFPRDHGLSAAFGLVGKVQIFQLAFVERTLNTGFQFIGELALLLNRGQDSLLARNQLAEVGQLFFDGPDLDLIQIARSLLSIAGDEGHGRAFIQEFNGCNQTLHGDLKRLGNVKQQLRRQGERFRHGKEPPFYRAGPCDLTALDLSNAPRPSPAPRSSLPS